MHTGVALFYYRGIFAFEVVRAEDEATHIGTDGVVEPQARS
jgi:hypothetical protein